MILVLEKLLNLLSEDKLPYVKWLARIVQNPVKVCFHLDQNGFSRIDVTLVRLDFRVGEITVHDLLRLKLEQGFFKVKVSFDSADSH